MPAVEDKPEPGGDDAAGRKDVKDDDNERPTVSPPFDPAELAKGTLSSRTPRPMAIVVPPPTSTGNPHTHVTPPRGMPVAGEHPNRKKTPVGLGGHVPDLESSRKKTPTSTLSLANARVPSNLPPRPPPRSAPPPALGAQKEDDDEWGVMELATRPPPPDGPGEDPIVEIAQERTPTIDLDDIDLGPSDLVSSDLIPPPSEPEGAETVRRPTPIGMEGAVPSRPDPLPPSGRGGEREMHDRVSLGDYSGALEIAEGILANNPEHAAAKACAENSRVVLRQMYATRIGPLDRVPVVMVPRDQFRWLSIDHKAGFVLSLVDGVSSLEMIIDVSGMPELDTLRILSELAQQRIISLR